MPSVRIAAAAILLAASSLPALAIQLSPHRATYAVSLDTSKPATRINAAEGRIVYEMRGNPCAGYSVQLRQDTILATEGGRVNSAVSTATWEEGEGQSYRFHVTNTLNGDSAEEADGVAERKEDGLVVTATKPERQTVGLGRKVLLPTQHVMRLIDSAEKGEAVLEASVFDGSPDARKVYDTLAVIGRGTRDATGLEAAATAGDLAGRARYPVTISYYERGGSSETPDYTIRFDMFDNGVSRDLKLDYGEFALNGTLISYEALPMEACSK
ncbi:cell envelope integrity EipB family protein [Ancylobacter dichloromethanicus]|uniref:ATP-binding protein n=1 Tax=Ancylobacter dichloromethanicus TaxID=518825 RepID=A0A9W6J7H5_9HYPH|nr:cell envelope integrity EipB family protein [Ancylobacter dichloromethanicus]MBS7554651.1 cell envelope integrity EipB family protein [Ancylobacter dichloromethanicus]GLK71782.1 ATP-binding protein [Ancylobacter dichloromethanicus]